MRPLHLFLAVLVAAIWGVNFVVIEVGLDHFPPLLFTALRFLVAAVPAVFLVKRPGAALGWIVVVGLLLGVAKFGLVFTGMHLGMPAGLTSLVLQVQAVFTAVFAVVFLRERLRPLRYLGMGVALAGIGVAAWAQGASGPLAAFSMIVAAAAFWGLANVATRRAAPPDALSWMVWVSLVPPLPLFALSLLVEGPEAGLAALRGLDPAGVGALLFIAWVATLFGFGVWGFLLREHDASAVAPFTLLVPVFGMLSAWVFLGEAVTALNLLAAVLLVGGVALTALGGGRSRAGGRGPGEGRGDGPGDGSGEDVSGGRTPGRAPSAAPGR